MATENVPIRISRNKIPTHRQIWLLSLSACSISYLLNQGSLTREPGRTTRGERQARERSFICRSPSLTLPPEPSPDPPVCGKIVFHKTGPWCQKVGDRCLKLVPSTMTTWQRPAPPIPSWVSQCLMLDSTLTHVTYAGYGHRFLAFL